MDIDLLPHVTDLLPHREPFLFVDRIIDADPPQSLTAEVKMHAEKDFFRGHFPGQPITPGVIILEAMTQATVLLSILSSDPKDRFRYLFVGADRFRVTGSVAPDAQVTLTARDILHKGRIVRGSVAALIGGDTVATAELTFMRDPLAGHD